MRRIGKSTKLIISMLMAATVLTGCGGTSDMATYTEESMSYTDDIYMNSAPMEYMMEEAVEEAKESGSTDVSQAGEQTARKLIKTVDMDVETEEYDLLFPKVEARITELGGYIENLNEHQDRYGSERGLRYANLTARIPEKNLDAFVTEVADASNVIDRSERVEDVTLSYVDLESHKAVLLTERDRLMELLENAETMEDIITIESRLSEVRYQIESMESKLRTYDNRINYSTVYLNISEVERLTPQVEVKAWDKIKTGFAESTYNVLRGIKNTTIGFIISIPYLVVWAIFIGIMILIVKLVIKANKKRQMKKQALYQKPVEMQTITKEDNNRGGHEQ